MCPTGPALSHPAAPMLKKFATEGYPTESTYEWNLAELDDAVEMGPPPVSTRDRRSKSLQKGSIGKSGARFLQPDTVENTSETFPDVLKVHPIAAIEHKSRSYRMILNVSKGGRGRHKDRPSLNESTVQEAAPLHSMQQLGKVLPRIIYALATWEEEDGPVLLVKLDLKDGFWRLAVPEDDELNFCYVLPKLDDTEETMMVVPSALQMGWTSSPPFFCAATETGRDVAETLRQLPPSKLTEHRYENDMLEPAEEDLFQKIQHPSKWPSLRTSAKGMQDEEIKSELDRFRRRFAPSARPSNWMNCPTPSTANKDSAAPTGSASNAP